LLILPPPTSPLFPYTTLFRSEATYFSKKSTDALVSKPLPPSIGSASSRYENIGRVDNSGFELGLNTQPVRNENLVWNLNLSGSLDRKSTRLNSSHVKISYAVF